MSHKLRGGNGFQTGYVQPLLSRVVGTPWTINWTWSGTNPTNWVIRSGTSQGATTTPVTTVAGGVFTLASVTAGLWYRVIGIDGGGNAITGSSNIVYTG